MKHWILTVATCLLLLHTQAQTQQTDNKLRLGITAGVNFQNINGQDAGGNKLENQLVPRFQAGVNADVPLADDFYLQPGVLFATKGTKFEGNNANLSLSYIEVPVHLLYKPALGSSRLLLGFGPYMAFGVGGSITPQNGSSTSVVFQREINLVQFASGRYYRPFDAGGNLLFGVETSSRIRLQFNAQLGMVNIAPAVTGLSGTNNNFRNTGFGISAGYRL
ncbi:MAG: outer membrane beta-barrel protein [Lacibacter sp.]